MLAVIAKTESGACARPIVVRRLELDIVHGTRLRAINLPGLRFWGKLYLRTANNVVPLDDMQTFTNNDRDTVCSYPIRVRHLFANKRGRWWFVIEDLPLWQTVADDELDHTAFALNAADVRA